MKNLKTEAGNTLEMLVATDQNKRPDDMNL